MIFSDVTPASTNRGSSRLAKAGSPTQPRPSEARVGVELAVDLEQDAAAQAAGLGDGAYARFAEGDDTEFGGDEEAVQRHQDQRQNDK
jgi:hypothetical protein